MRAGIPQPISTLPGMPVAIVPRQASHIDSFRACIDGVARERKYLVFTEAPPPEATRDFIEASLREGDPQFVAVEEGNVVGWCDIIRNRRPVMAHGGTLGIGLAPAYRHQGLGRRLMAAALEAARARGFERVDLFVYASNLNAIRLYESMGFVREGYRRKLAKIDGSYLDAVDMAWFP